MGVNYLTDEQLSLSEENPYAIKSITYSEEFKELLLELD